MNLTLSSSANATLPAAATQAVAEAGAAPALAAPTPESDPQGLPLETSAPLPATPLPQFGLWLDQAGLATGAQVPVEGAAPQEPAQPDHAQESPEEVPLTGAMAMPIMPLAHAAQATLAAVAAALPGAPETETTPAVAEQPDAQARPVDTGAADSATTASAAQSTALPAPLPAVQSAPLQAATLPFAYAATQPAPVPAQASVPAKAEQAHAAPARRDGAIALDLAALPAQVRSTEIPVQLPADPLAPRAPLAAASSGTSGNPPAHAKADSPSAGFAAAMNAAATDQAGPAPERSAPMNGAIVINSGAPVVDTGADTVTLAGPPTAWRQSLQEALGERLQMQLGRNSEQAVIRLEPPMLGQVEIAIRHSAGALEVHISATHRDVVRQLQAVSDNLRNDLAQRQFTEVAVNVSATRAGQGAAGSFGGDGRRQGGQDQPQLEDWTPGMALAEAHHAAAFSLQGRK